MCEEYGKMAGCCVYIVITIASIIMIAMSFSKLEVNTVGIDYDTIQKTIAPGILTSGIHFLGLGHRFIEYP